MQHNKATVKFSSVVGFLFCDKNYFKHLILNYLDNIELTDVIVRFYCLASIFLCVIASVTFFFSLSSSSSQSLLTYLREMIEQCPRACGSTLFRGLDRFVTFIDRTIKTITVIKLQHKEYEREKKNNLYRQKHIINRSIVLIFLYFVRDIAAHNIKIKKKYTHTMACDQQQHQFKCNLISQLTYCVGFCFVSHTNMRLHSIYIKIERWNEINERSAEKQSERNATTIWLKWWYLWCHYASSYHTRYIGI